MYTDKYLREDFVFLLEYKKGRLNYYHHHHKREFMFLEYYVFMYENLYKKGEKYEVYISIVDEKEKYNEKYLVRQLEKEIRNMKKDFIIEHLKDFESIEEIKKFIDDEHPSFKIIVDENELEELEYNKNCDEAFIESYYGY